MVEIGKLLEMLDEFKMERVLRVAGDEGRLWKIMDEDCWWASDTKWKGLGIGVASDVLVRTCVSGVLVGKLAVGDKVVGIASEVSWWKNNFLFF